MTQGHAFETWTDENTDTYSGWFDIGEMLFASGTIEQETPWQQSKQRLIDIQKLDEGWDGEGAEKIDPEIIKTAKILFQQLSENSSDVPSRIIPTNDGAVVIEWRLDGFYTQAEIETPYLIEWMERSPEGIIRHWDENLIQSNIDAYQVLDAKALAA